MILTVTPNPSVDHTFFVHDLVVGATNRAFALERDAGGKGINVSRVLTALSVPTLATGFLGGGTGAYVRHALNEENVKHDFVKTSGETRVNFEIEDESGTPPTNINAPGPAVDAAEVETLMLRIHQRLRFASWVVMAGSLPPGMNVDFFARVGEMARKAGKPFAVDADGEPLRLAIAEGPSLVKPNEEEIVHLLGCRVRTDDEAVAAVRTLHEMLFANGSPPDALAILSRGADGACAACREDVWLGSSPKIKVRSTIGSGDSMVAAVVGALNRQLSPDRALQLGLAAGAATAEREGAGLARIEDVNRLLPQAKAVLVEESRLTL